MQSAEDFAKKIYPINSQYLTSQVANAIHARDEKRAEALIARCKKDIVLIPAIDTEKRIIELVDQILNLNLLRVKAGLL
jgi:hypothetical protein